MKLVRPRVNLYQIRVSCGFHDCYQETSTEPFIEFSMATDSSAEKILELSCRQALTTLSLVLVYEGDKVDEII